MNLIKCIAMKRYIYFAQKIFILIQDYTQNNVRNKHWHPATIPCVSTTSETTILTALFIDITLYTIE
jgi:hypothetical protein